MIYNLNHLTQPPHQRVVGPIQDDEALTLFGIIKVMRLKHIVEIGAHKGYSAKNFLEAVGNNGHVIGIDIFPTTKWSENHTTIIKNAKLVTSEEIPWEIDLIFYDCHDLEASMRFHSNMVKNNKITKRTILALHDTNLHPGGKIHQPVEREMVNLLVEQGWSAICLHTRLEYHDESLPFRHGLTLMQQFVRLET